MIELNKVGIEIDGKVYQMRKMSFGFQRRMIALQEFQRQLLLTVKRASQSAVQILVELQTILKS